MILRGVPSGLLIGVSRRCGRLSIRLLHLNPRQLGQSGYFVPWVISERNNRRVVRETTACLLVGTCITSGVVETYVTASDGLINDLLVVVWVRQFRFESSFFVFFFQASGGNWSWSWSWSSFSPGEGSLYLGWLVPPGAFLRYEGGSMSPWGGCWHICKSSHQLAFARFRVLLLFFAGLSHQVLQ